LRTGIIFTTISLVLPVVVSARAAAKTLAATERQWTNFKNVFSVCLEAEEPMVKYE
jgi:hypothetical protein